MTRLFVDFPLVALSSAALLAASPAISAGTHHPARKATAHKAASQDKVSAWLKQCDTEELACENRLLRAPVLSSPKTKCMTGDEADSYNLTPKVRAWFQTNPEHNKDKIDAGIAAAVTAIYPCN